MTDTVSAAMRRDLSLDMFADLTDGAEVVDWHIADGITVLTFGRELTEVEVTAVRGRMTSPDLVAALAELLDPEADPDLRTVLANLLAYALGLEA